MVASDRRSDGLRQSASHGHLSQGTDRGGKVEEAGLSEPAKSQRHLKSASEKVSTHSPLLRTLWQEFDGNDNAAETRNDYSVDRAAHSIARWESKLRNETLKMDTAKRGLKDERKALAHRHAKLSQRRSEWKERTRRVRSDDYRGKQILKDVCRSLNEEAVRLHKCQRQAQLSQSWLDERKKKLVKLSKNITTLKDLMTTSPSSFDPLQNELHNSSSVSSPDVFSAEHSDIWYEFDNLEKELDTDISLLDTFALDQHTGSDSSPSPPDGQMYRGDDDSDGALAFRDEFGGEPSLPVTGRSSSWNRSTSNRNSKSDRDQGARERGQSRGRASFHERDTRKGNEKHHYYDDSDIYLRTSSNQQLYPPRRSSSPTMSSPYSNDDDENMNMNTYGAEHSHVRRSASAFAADHPQRRSTGNIRVRPAESLGSYGLQATSLDEPRLFHRREVVGDIGSVPGGLASQPSHYRFGSRPPESEAAGALHRPNHPTSHYIHDRDHYLLRADLNIAASRQQRAVRQQLDSAALRSANTKSEFETHAK
jgi:hypothetical protein